MYAIRSYYGTRPEVKVGGVRRVRASGVDDGHPRAALPGLGDQPHLVDVGLGRVVAPDEEESALDREPRMVVPVGAIGQPGGLEPGGPAEVPVGEGAASEGVLV